MSGISRAIVVGGITVMVLLLWSKPLWGAVELDEDSSESQIMGFYAAALTFTPVGPSEPKDDFDAGVELTGVPRLSEEDRTTTFAGAKVENTNYTPILPRPHFRWKPGPGWLLDGSYVPALDAFDIRLKMYGISAARRIVAMPRQVALWGRLQYVSAEIEGPITCSQDAVEDPTNSLCFGGQVSNDTFLPNLGGVELLLETGRLGSERLGGYVSLGYQWQRLRFETDFVNVFGRKDDQILEANRGGPAYTVGLTWIAWRNLRITGEGLYVPDALATAKLGVTYGWGGS